MSIREQVIDVIADQLKIEDKSTITDDSNFIEDLNADSLDTVELVMALEEKFGVSIPDQDAEKITTVRAAIEYINNLED